MLISLNKIKEYVKIDIPTDELITLIGSRLVEVEGHSDLSAKYQGIKIVKVLSAEPIPETHLHLCQIATGEAEAIQVVCGAPNVHASMLAAWIMPGSVVPSTYGNENFKLSVRKLRGYDSHGMLAAADELDLGSDHAGIIEIDPKMPVVGSDGETRPVQAGDDFAAAFGLNDIILDIENKSLTHRPDCFGLIGFAREVAGILGQPFTEPAMLDFTKNHSENGALTADLDITITNPELCPRYSCAILDCNKLLEKGKYFTRQDAFLAKCGMRSISPIVDLTNVLMLETGQPLHAFDYDKFIAVGGGSSPKIIVRLAEPGEKLQLLDGKTIACTDSDILITSNNVPVALAGAMGGASTEIDASSNKIILESATFSLYNLRKTQMAHGIFSEAITRFTKGQPAANTMPVLQEAIRRLETTPLGVADSYPQPAKQNVVKITTEEINNLLGTSYDANLIKTTLENVGFIVKPGFEIVAPLWRTDIHIKEDIIEEVGRLLGFDNIPIALPVRTFAGTEIEPMWQLKTTLRNILSNQLGLHELLTYSFISSDLLEKVGEDSNHSYKIVNSISPELQYFRQSLIPSLLDKILMNLRAGHEDFGLYEINQVINKTDILDEDQVPPVHMHLAVVCFGDFYRVKQLAEFITERLRIELGMQNFTNGPAYFEPRRSATTALGHYGEIRRSVLRRFKLDQYQISALEWDLGPVLSLPKKPITPSSLSMGRYPAVARDLTFKTPDSVSFAELQESLTDALKAEGLLYQITVLSIYQPDTSADIRNISFHLDFANPERTLGSDEISAIIERVTNKITTLGAEAI